MPNLVPFSSLLLRSVNPCYKSTSSILKVGSHGLRSGNVPFQTSFLFGASHLGFTLVEPFLSSCLCTRRSHKGLVKKLNSMVFHRLLFVLFLTSCFLFNFSDFILGVDISLVKVIIIPYTYINCEKSLLTSLI